MKKIIFIGLLSFLLALIWQLPLSFAKPYVEKLVEGLKLEGVKGSVWNGSAQRLIAKNNDFGQVSWQLKPLQSLTSLSLKSSFTINGNQLSADGIAGVTPGKTIILNDTKFKVDANYLNNLQSQAKLSGDLQGDIHHAEFKENTLPVLDAEIDWNKAAVSSMLIKLTEGDYHFAVTPDPEGLLIKPTSKKAPLNLNGEVKLSKEWILKPDVKVSSTNQSVAGMLKLAGKIQADGSTHITQSTDLKPFLRIK